MSFPQRDDDWDQGDPRVFDGQCARCGIMRPVIFSRDPYIVEALDQHCEPENFCYPCWRERKDDI